MVYGLADGRVLCLEQRGAGIAYHDLNGPRGNREDGMHGHGGGNIDFERLVHILLEAFGFHG